MTLHDQHIHSKYSHDSNESLTAYLDKAKNLGCKYFVTTEHYDLDVSCIHKDLVADFSMLKEELNQLKSQYPSLQFLLGIELGYRKDYLEEMNEILNKEKFDLINLSIHDSKDDDFYYYRYFEKKGEINLLHKYFDIMIEATATFTNYNVLSHLDYGFKTVYLVNKNIKISMFEKQIKIIFQNIIKNKKALEINTKVQEALNDDEHLKYLLKLYKSLGGKRVTLSSDAHNVSRYLSKFAYYQKIIKECGFDYLVYYIKQQEYYFYI